jgi:hypothetical protein
MRDINPKIALVTVTAIILGGIALTGFAIYAFNN